MSKAVLLIDMPEDCTSCPLERFVGITQCGITRENTLDCQNKRHEKCPLIPSEDLGIIEN